MKIQHKLSLGIGLMCTLMLLLTAVSMTYVRNLSDASRSILEANYNSIDYVRHMLVALESDSSGTFDSSQFSVNLEKQLHNITEDGEKEVTERIAKNYTMLETRHNDQPLLSHIRNDLSLVMMLNMKALERKSLVARRTGEIATQWITATATLCFLIFLMMFVNLPSTLSKPIKELLEGIKQISSKNYSQRLHINRKDEFGELAHSFNFMALQLEEFNKTTLSKLLIEKRRIETLINNMRDPVIGLDETHTIVFVNDEAVNVLGIPRTQLLLRNATELALSNDLLRSLMKNVIEHPQVTSTTKEQLKIYADNKESYFEKELVPIMVTSPGDSAEQHIGDVIILKNITQFKEYDFAKSNFIATVSHELKTPISAIKMSLQLLENKDTGIINDNQQQLIHSMEDDCERLLKISAELLNMTQAETGNIKLNIQSSDAYDIIRYSTEAARALAEQKQISFNVITEADLPRVVADAEKATWVMINLLTNAVRYSTEKSEVKITVVRRSSELEFSVQDVGKGIDARYRHKIFDRYFQIPGSNKSGSGLGLAISKEFIEAQGGSIGMESEIGYGSRFWFRLKTV